MEDANSLREVKRCWNDFSLCVVLFGVLAVDASSSRGGIVRGTMATACMAASRKEGRPGRLDIFAFANVHKM